MNGLLTVSMIVKNEERFLPECLASIKNVADEIIIVDTGSTDRTVDIAKSFGARVIEVEWPNDFAKARNVGLDAVKTPWVLVMDADEELVKDDVPTLEIAITHPIADGYNIRIVSLMDNVNDINESYVTRLFRSHPLIRFEGAIHEQVFPAMARNNLALHVLDVRLIHKGYLGAVIDQKNKNQRNVSLLRDHLTHHPDDGYITWQLSQSLLGMSAFKEGLQVAKRAMTLLAPDNPIWVLAVITLSRLYSYNDQPKRAIKTLQDGQTVFPKYTDFHYNEGIIRLQMGQASDAERCFRTCLELGEARGFIMTDTGVGGFKSYYRLAQSLSKQGRSKEALAYLLVAIQRSPSYRQAWQAVLGLLAGSTFESVVKTLQLTVPLDVIVNTVGHWSNRSEDEERLLETARIYLETAIPKN